MNSQLNCREIFNKSFKLFTQILMEKNKEVETKFLEYFSQILQAQRIYKNTNHRKKFYIARHIRKKKAKLHTRNARCYADKTNRTHTYRRKSLPISHKH